MSQTLHTNRLAGETSPYLLQHAHNPVDWYPWGDEAFAKAKAEDKPILLSIGYAACHWCHVMERESFENDAIARVMNENFVCIKVDREERPDVDEIYMTVVQAMTGHGGWPMTMFLTPDAKPFYGGTYFPPQDRYGMPGFPSLLEHLSRAYKEKRDEVTRGAEGWADQLQRTAGVPRTDGPPGSLSLGLIDHAVDRMSRRFNSVNGGFGGPPKFPHSMDLSLFMRAYRRTGRLDLMAQVRKSLDKMEEGGIYDQVGGGFHRYSVDERWAVPHFEKMLYDNALLARTYLEAHQVTGEASYAEIARQTLDYVLREMRDPAGGFWSSQDADSEGEEGKFFVWSPEELSEVLTPEEAGIAAAVFGVTDSGNFEHGKTVLYVAKYPAQLASELSREPKVVGEILRRAREKLYAARSKRVHPGTDDKVLTSWNGLMISAMCDGFRVLGKREYLDAATAAADFILTKMSSADGRLLRTYRAGQSKLNAYLEDYGAFITALCDLYEAGFETRWIREAVRLSSVMLDQYWDDGEGGFHFTGKSHEPLLVRTKPYYDGATPSGNSLAVAALLRVARLSGEERFAERAKQTLELFTDLMSQAPEAFPNLLAAVDFYLSPPLEIAVVGDRSDPATTALLEAAWRRFMPARVMAAAEPAAVDSAAAVIPLLRGKTAQGGKPAAYVCHNFACTAPVHTPKELEDELDRS